MVLVVLFLFNEKSFAQQDCHEALSPPLSVSEKMQAELDGELFDAISSYDLNGVRNALDLGSDVNAVGENGDTPLHAAVIDRDYNIIYFLIKRGADVNAVNRNGDTPLHYALLENDITGVRLLLENGADVNAVNRNGDTPRGIAKRYGYKTIINIFKGM